MMADDREHMLFGGSTAHRWLRCAGSVKLAAAAPPIPSGEHARRGTHAHALLELALRERRTDVSEFNGRALLPDHEPFNEEDVAAVQLAVDWVVAAFHESGNGEMFIEHKMKLHDDTGGTADCMIYHPDEKRLRVIDYKHGTRYVPEDAAQLKFYALCALATVAERLPVKRIDATVIQPRAFGADPARTAVYTPADLMGFDDEVDMARAAAKADSPSFAAGAWCQYCPGAAVCPALQGSVVKAAAGWPAANTSVTITLPPASSLRDPQRLAETLAVLPTVQAFIDAIEEAALALAVGGTRLPGFKLVEKTARRSWEDEAAALRWFEQNTPLAPDDYAPRVLLSVAQAEKLVKADKATMKELAGLVEKKSSGLKLVPETAKGQAVDPSVAMSMTAGAPVALIET